MKKIICITLIVLIGVPVFAEIALPFFGNNNFNLDVDTTFSANMNNGATGLLTNMGMGLWFEFVPYQDRNITPQRDVFSVSLKLANSAVYAWRGYGLSDGDTGEVYDPSYHGYRQYPNDITPLMGDQAMSVWFDTIIAQLEYNQYWVRIAGIEPEVALSQASIKSVFDSITANRTAIDKNSMYLPLFRTASHYRPWPNHGIVSVIGQDLVHLNRREVAIAGNLSVGMKTEIFDLAVKGGSWKPASENLDNAWVGGADFTIRPDLSNTIRASLLGAVNYGEIDLDNDIDKNDPMQNKTALVENPLAAGIGYDYRISLPGRMIMKPYVGFDFIYETKSGEYDFEFGGGLQWFFRGTSAQFKRNTNIGGSSIGDVNMPAALFMGMNMNREGIINAVISINEDPRSSLIPGFGGFFLMELMNIGGKDYKAWDATTGGLKDYNDFLWAFMAQVEYFVHDKVMPYIFFRYMPAVMPVNYRADDPLYGKDFITLTSKLGCRFTPFGHFSIDMWYERNDFSNKDEWAPDDGLLSVTFGISL
jgi:hypothetical protein